LIEREPASEETRRHQDADASGDSIPPEVAHKMLHELRVHQIELELQNEELRSAQEQLEEARARYFDLYETAPVGYFTLNRAGVIQEANLTAADLLGMPRDKLLEQPLTRFILPADQDIYYLHGRQLVEKHGREVSEFRVLTNGREPRWVRFEEIAVTDARGDLVRRAIMSDIDAQMRAEATLRASEARHRILFEKSRDALMTLAPPDWRLSSGNATTLALFGVRDQGDLQSRSLSAYSPVQQPDGSLSADRAAALLDSAMVEGSRYYEWTFKRLSGEEFPATVLLTRIEIDGRTLLQATVRDETEVKRMQASLSQQDRLASMGMLAAGVAHEINNPLANVLYNVETLAEDLPRLAGAVERCVRALCTEQGPQALEGIVGQDAGMLQPEVLRDFIDRAREAFNSAQRVKTISRAIGTFARVESTERSRVDLNYTIRCAITMAQNDIKFRARLATDLATLPAVWASEGKLSQVFLNLLINAAQAFEGDDLQKNEIQIRTWAEGEDVFAEVKDNGKGISRETSERIFEPFFTTKRVGEGSGLGLAICRNIVTDFGGHIRVESKLGEGTRFVIHLPVRQGASVTPRARPSSAPGGDSSPRGRILVVDDEELMRSMLTRMLGRRHEVVSACSGMAAKAILERDPSFDIILCDLMMPEMTGMELHEWLTRHRPTLADRVVFISGGAFTPKASEYVARVGNVRLERPFEIRKVEQLLSAMIEARRAHRPS
jgi:two-component system cell cycle sensor histidine kinase/response regulator CckA